MSQCSPDIEQLARRIETTPVDGKFGTRLFAMSDAERDLVVRLLRSHWDHAAEYIGGAAGARTCATCHAVLADGPQPAATYARDMTLADLITMIDMVENHTDAIDLADKLWPMICTREVAQPSLETRLAEAERVIRGVVTSYPVAAGTSKYGFEEDHDGYGSIRECRLYLERTSISAQEDKS